MNQRNCPNCGAPYDAVSSTCPYCGTAYERKLNRSKICNMTIDGLINVDVFNKFTGEKIMSFKPESWGVTETR